jgi:hypothetical protein
MSVCSSVYFLVQLNGNVLAGVAGMGACHCLRRLPQDMPQCLKTVFSCDMQQERISEDLGAEHRVMLCKCWLRKSVMFSSHPGMFVMLARILIAGHAAKGEPPQHSITKITFSDRTMHPTYSITIWGIIAR